MPASRHSSRSGRTAICGSPKTLPARSGACSSHPELLAHQLGADKQGFAIANGGRAAGTLSFDAHITIRQLLTVRVTAALTTPCHRVAKRNAESAAVLVLDAAASASRNVTD